MVSKLAVLIVDDEPLVCEGLKNTLSDQPYEIHTAGSGQEALKTLQSQN
jgi:YesN/AraC family two-component response regulator